MLQISDNAAALIKKMTARNGIPDGGLRIGIKAGGCSGLSYTFAWEAAPREGDHVFEGAEGSKVFVDPKSYQFIQGNNARLRHRARQPRVHFQQPEREIDVRVWDEF